MFTDAEPDGARSRYGDTLEQLGYGVENGTWRNFFLSGPTELRDGNFGTPAVTAAPAVTTQLSLEQLFDSLAIAVDSPAAWDLALSLDVTFSDIGTSYRLTLRNGVLVYVERPAGGPADATLTLAKGRLLGLLGGYTTIAGIDIAGDANVLPSPFGVLDKGDPSFNIVTP